MRAGAEARGEARELCGGMSEVSVWKTRLQHSLYNSLDTANSERVWQRATATSTHTRVKQSTGAGLLLLWGEDGPGVVRVRHALDCIEACARPEIEYGSKTREPDASVHANTLVNAVDIHTW